MEVCISTPVVNYDYTFKNIDNQAKYAGIEIAAAITH
jgi:hypothetical protein